MSKYAFTMTKNGITFLKYKVEWIIWNEANF